MDGQLQQANGVQLQGFTQGLLQTYVRKAANGYSIHGETMHHMIMASDVLLLGGVVGMQTGQLGKVLGPEGTEEDLLKVLDFHTSKHLSNITKGFLTFRVLKGHTPSFFIVRLRVGRV
jgi:hypothetical protein